jgi:hypothetical protein
MRGGSPRCSTKVNGLVYFRVYAQGKVRVMQVSLAVLADYASVSIDNKLNILGVFHEVNTPILPVTVPLMYLVVSFEAEPAEYGKQLLARVVLSEECGNGDPLLSLEGLAEVPQPARPEDRAYSNQVIGLSGVRFERVGDYRFSIFVDDQEVAVVPLRVNKLE